MAVDGILKRQCERCDSQLLTGALAKRPTAKHRSVIIALGLFLVGLLSPTPILRAQSRTTLELLPQFSWNGELNSRWSWSLNTSLESDISEKIEGMAAQTAFSTHTYNLQGGLAYQWTSSLNLSAGYQFGWRALDEDEKDIEHRFLQQLSWGGRWEKYRLRVRARTEQRFFRSNNWQARHRWRLRGALDFPLQGERLDPGETYLNLQSEWLANVLEEAALANRETRLYAGLGWKADSRYRLENGLEWRTRLSGAGNDRRHRLIFRLTFTFNWP